MIQPLENKAVRKAVDSQAVQFLLITGVTLLAVALRFFKLGEWSYWIDEAFTLQRALDSLHSASLTIPLSTRLIGLFTLMFGTGEWSTRLAPALIGVVTIPVLYLVFRRLFDAFTALLAVLLLALSPFHLYWSQNARFYTALLLLYTLAFFAFYFWLEKDQARYLALAIVLMGLATLERKMALFLAPVAVAYLGALRLLAFELPPAARRLTWKNVLLWGLPVLAFGAYQVITGLPSLIGNFVAYPTNPVKLLLSTVYDIGLPLFLMALLGGVYLVVQKRRIGLFLLTGAVLPLLIILAIAPFAKSESRYIFHTYPIWTLLGAIAAREILTQTNLHTKILATGIMLLLIAEPLSQDALYYLNYNGGRQDWKAAFARVESSRQPGDVVATTRPELAEYYLHETPVWTDQLRPKDVIRAGKRTWFVVDDRTAYLSPELQSWLVENTRLVGVHDVVLPGKPMPLRVYLYEPQPGT